MDEITPASPQPPKRPYHRPELRDLGSLAVLTEAATNPVPGPVDSANSYPS